MKRTSVDIKNTCITDVKTLWDLRETGAICLYYVGADIRQAPRANATNTSFVDIKTEAQNFSTRTMFNALAEI